MPLPAKPSLADIRAEIDRIDASIHGLLMDRSEVIEALIEVKKTVESGSAFRPAREADVIRALIGRHRGRLPVNVLVSLWRQIISTFTFIQAPHDVHLGTEGDAIVLNDLARAHFGFGLPFHRHVSPKEAIAGVMQGRGDLGVLALEGAKTAWWRALGVGDNPIVMATTPVFGTGDTKAEALIIARPATDVGSLERRVFCGRSRNDLSAHPSVLACVQENGAFEVLAWGEASESLEASAAKSAPDLEAVHLVGYTASPVRL